MTGTITTSAQSTGSGTSAVAVMAPVTGLMPNTTYYFEVQATNTIGTTPGATLTFATASLSQAVVTTQPATAVKTTGATLNASVNPDGSGTSVSFIYGTDPTLTTDITTTATQSIGSGTSTQTVQAPVTGLAAEHDVFLRGASDQRGRHHRRLGPQIQHPRIAPLRDDPGGHGGHGYRGHPERQRESGGDRDDRHFRLRHRLDLHDGHHHDHCAQSIGSGTSDPDGAGAR